MSSGSSKTWLLTFCFECWNPNSTIWTWKENAPNATNNKSWENCNLSMKQTFGTAYTEFVTETKTISKNCKLKPTVKDTGISIMRLDSVQLMSMSPCWSARWPVMWGKIQLRIFNLLSRRFPRLALTQLLPRLRVGVVAKSSDLSQVFRTLAKRLKKKVKNLPL